MPTLIGCLGLLFFGIVFLGGCGIQNGVLMGIGFIGGIASLACGVFFESKRKKGLKDDLKTQINNIIKNVNDFKPTQEFLAEDRESFIAIDEERKKICIVENQIKNVVELSEFNKYNFTYKLFNYSDILQVSLLEDGVQVTRTSRTSQLGGALLGGVLGGEVGAIIGGLSGSQKTETEIKKVQLQIVVNDSKKTFYRITLALFESRIPKSSYAYKQKEDAIYHWYNLLSFVIKVADKDDDDKQDNKQEEKQETKPNNIIDELTKLAQLYKDGILTDEEFNKQKQKLLSE